MHPFRNTALLQLTHKFQQPATELPSLGSVFFAIQSAVLLSCGPRFTFLFMFPLSCSQHVPPVTTGSDKWCRIPKCVKFKENTLKPESELQSSGFHSGKIQPLPVTVPYGGKNQEARMRQEARRVQWPQTFCPPTPPVPAGQGGLRSPRPDS